MEEEVCIGQVLHYYSRINVAVLELIRPLYVGQMVRIKNRNYDFVQPVDRMEWEHLPIVLAEPGQRIGIKTSHKAHEHDKVYLV